MQHQPALLLDRFDLNKTHSRPPYRLADRLGVGGIVLVALDISFHVLRRHQPYLVAKLLQFTCPPVGCRAGFHADKARRKRLEERQHPAAPQSLANNNLLAGIDAVNLEHVLGGIQTDRCDLHVDSSLM